MSVIFFLFYRLENCNLKIRRYQTGFSLGLPQPPGPRYTHSAMLSIQISRRIKERAHHTTTKTGVTTALTNQNVVFRAIFNNKMHHCSQSN